MSTAFGALRRRLLTPPISETTMKVRGFHVKNPESRKRLEEIGETFLQGYAFALQASSAPEAEDLLETVPHDLRGFAYEGAAMGAVVHDALPGHSGRLAGLLAGRGRHHDYMIHVGIGWAMARLPRPLWPDIRTTDPLLRWLALDGFGFHQAYFKTPAYVRDPSPPPPLRWNGGHNHYTAHAIDQGIGRALWFVGGTDPATVAQLIASYAPPRHADLWAGAGLACTYAGGATEEELTLFARQAGEHRWALAQGAAFAAEARTRAALVSEHTHRATRAVCGISVQEASRICNALKPAAASPNALPAYENWRRDISAHLASASTLRKGADQ
ncbi:DUF1702 family protein [Streptomyces sp. NPDC017448]|uniref:DUF1702 family protein n=1 Tax=Streptomyces sp. NPDC017448 TaxID=3364996 RepID=UPI0037BA8FDD